jgi:hypothetical protein
MLQLPPFLDHMLAFISLASSMMAFSTRPSPRSKTLGSNVLVVLDVIVWPLKMIILEIVRCGQEWRDTGILKHPTKPPRQTDCTTTWQSWHDRGRYACTYDCVPPILPRLGYGNIKRGLFKDILSRQTIRLTTIPAEFYTSIADPPALRNTKSNIPYTQRTHPNTSGITLFHEVTNSWNKVIVVLRMLQL